MGRFSFCQQAVAENSEPDPDADKSKQLVEVERFPQQQYTRQKLQRRCDVKQDTHGGHRQQARAGGEKSKGNYRYRSTQNQQ